MSKTIDQKVVEMRFDNSKFEKNVKQSMSSIDKLKQSLNFSKTSKDIDSLNKSVQKVDLKPLEMSAVRAGFHISDVWEKVTREFEQVFAVRIVNATQQMIKSLSTDQISAGWDKYEQKTQNVQTLMNSTGKSIDEVNEYLAELMWYSDETSFGFTDMTSALATMTSSGGDIEKLIPMIEGMGNATAYAGKGAAEFSRVIYNLNQSYSQGFLSTMDWRSVQNAGAASKQLQEYLIQAAEQVGSIRKGMYSIQDFPTLLSKKLITSDAMEIAFTRFAEYTRAIKQAVDDGTYETATEAMQAMGTEGFDEVAIKAFQAAQNAKSFSEAIDATKDAVSSGWQRIFEVIFGDLNQATELWTDFCGDLWEIFASGFEGRVDWLSSFFSNSSFDIFKGKLEEARVEWKLFEDAAKGLSQTNINFGKIISENGGFEEAFLNGAIDKSAFDSLWKEVTHQIEKTHYTIGEYVKEEIDYTKVVNDVIRGVYGSGEARHKALTEAGWDYKIVQDKVNKVLWHQDVVLKEINETSSENNSRTIEQIKALSELKKEFKDSGEMYEFFTTMMSGKTGRDLAIESIANALHGLMAVLDTIKEAWNNIFPRKTATQMYAILFKISKLSQKLLPDEDQADKLRRTFEGLFSVVGIGVDAFKVFLDVIKQIFEAIPKGEKSILDITASWGDWLKALRESIRENQTFQKVGKFVVDVFKGIIKVVQTVKDKFVEFWGVLKENQYVKEAIEWLDEKFNGALTSIKDNLGITEEGVSGLFDKLSSLIENLKFDKVLSGVDRVGAFFESFNTTLSSTEGGLSGFNLKIKKAKTNLIAAFSADSVEDMQTSMTSMFGDTDALANTSDTLSKIGDGFKTFFSNIDTDKMKNIAIVFGTLFAAGSISTGVDKIYKVFANIGGVGAKIKETLTVAQRSMQTFQKAIRAKSLLYIALAIGVLSASMAALTLVDSEKLRKVAWSLFIVAGAISMLTLAIGGGGAIAKIGESSLEKLSTMLLSFSLSLLAISVALVLVTKYLSDVDNKTIWRSIGFLSVIILEMLVVASLLSRSKEQFTTSGVGLILFSLSILAIIKVLKLIGEDISLVKDNIKPLMYVLASLLAIAYILKVGGKNGKPVKAALGMLLFSLSLLSLFGVLKLLCFIGLDDIMDNIKPIFAVIVGILALAYAISKAGKDAHKAGISILAISGGIFILVLAIKELAKIPEDDLKKGLLSLVALIVMVDSMLIVTKSAAGVDKRTITNLLLLVGGVLLGLFALSNVKDPNSLIKVAESIAIVIGSLTFMVGAFALLNRAIGKGGKKDKKNNNKIGNYILASLLMLLSVGAVLVLVANLMPKERDINELLPITKAMVPLIISLGAAMSVMAVVSKGSNTKSLLAAGGALAIASLSLIGIATALALISNYVDPATISAFTPMLWNMLGVLVVISLVSALLSKVGPTVILGAVWLDAIAAVIAIGVAAIGAIIAGIGWILDKIGTEDVLSNMDTAIQFAGKVGEFFGALIGGFLSGVSEGVASLIESTGEALGAFGNSIVPFIETMQTVDESFFAGITMLSLGIAELAVADFIANITTLFGVGLISFALMLNKFSSILSEGFLKDMSDLDPNTTSSIKTLAEALLVLTEANLLNSISNFLNVFGGDSSIVNFAKGMGILGLGVKAFATATADMPTDNLEQAVNAAKVLGELEKGLPKHGGILQTWIGDNNLDKFGDGMEELATSIVRFCQRIDLAGDVIDEDSVNKAANIAKIMSELEAGLPKHDGVLQKWMGDADLETFGKGMERFGYYMTQFCAKIAQNIIKEDNVEKVRTIGDIMAELDGSLTAHGGVKQWFMGDNDLETFGAGLVAFGTYMKEYCDTIGHIREGSDKYNDMVVAMAKGLNEINISNTSGGFWGLIAGDDDLDNFGKSIKNFGKYMSDYANEIEEINTVNMGLVVNETVKIVDLLDKIGDGSKSAALVTFADNVKSFASTVMETFKAELTDTETKADAIDSVVTFIGYCADGIIDNKSEMVTAMSDAVEDMVKSLTQNNHDRDAYEASATIAKEVQKAASFNLLNGNSPYQMYKVGVNAVQGFINGLNSKKDAVKQAGMELGLATKNGTEQALKIESPSKVMFQDGAYAVQGFINGIKTTAAAAVQAVKDKGKNIVESFMGNATDIINSDLNLNPTITPVLDDSLIQNGVKDLNSMFDTKEIGTTYAAFNNIPKPVSDVDLQHYINEAMSNYNQPIVDAINRSTEVGQEIKVTLNPDTAKFYKEMRVENRRFIKSTGYSGMVY